ncbi:hypothetical protein HBHAL_4378 [Halobacillus halophilus DSM 2266]|uniref:Uncharacterized protein n=1 Tax=Halobacillus halophilus (strain ATCC 35676 / DSM 2266 / JCM 20832 / KCTC 3685 / LMG 17431 / NBRC 102448 / NCIMB 2269) TaxID=866895 RepID=I0JRE8_HALH3|nr:hypothetical protein HBHAL_4378 [Halobacillus halophilus DSM 2266]
MFVKDNSITASVGLPTITATIAIVFTVHQLY